MGDIKRSSFVTASGIGRRIFLGQIVPFYFYLLFQEQFGYMGIGSFFPNPGGMLPFEPISYTTIIMKFATGSDGSMPTVFFGQWFISFGPLMSLLSMLIMGFILQFVDILFISKLNKCKSLLLSTMFILVIQYMGGFVETGNSGILIDPRWIMPGFFLSIIYLSILTLKKIANKNTTKHNLVNPY